MTTHRSGFLFVAGFGFDHTLGEWAGVPSPTSMWASDALFLCGSWASCNTGNHGRWISGITRIL